MTETAIPFTLTRRAIDPRADGAVRTVHLSASRVTIERSFEGVRMRVGVPTAAYRDLVICVRTSARGEPPGAMLRLRHDDSELDVVIGSGEAEEVARSARAWSAVTGKAVSVEFGGVAMRTAQPHPFQLRRSAQRTSSRPGLRRGRLGRFALRRAPGVAARLATRFRGEREIIARH